MMKLHNESMKKYLHKCFHLHFNQTRKRDKPKNTAIKKQLRQMKKKISTIINRFVSQVEERTCIRDDRVEVGSIEMVDGCCVEDCVENCVENCVVGVDESALI
jgi:hypothetical protein